MRWLFLLLTMAAVTRADWKLGIWWEITPGRDTAAARSFAGHLARDFDQKLRARGGRGATLMRLTLVPAGRLPIAGSDPSEHPDLRDSTIDLEWGVPAARPVPAYDSVESAWLRALGVPDPSTFALGWDLFTLTRDGQPLMRTPDFPLIEERWIHLPSWKLIDSTGVDSFANLLAAQDTITRGPRLARRETTFARLRSALPADVTISLRDADGRPVQGTVLLWHARADSRRAYAGLFSDAHDSLSTDTGGDLHLSREQWFGGELCHGREGSNLQVLLRTRTGDRLSPWTWLDARDIVLHRGKITLSLPAGRSEAWRLASKAYPRQLIAAESDTSCLWVGLSLPEASSVVLRLEEPDGREIFRSRPFTLAAGAWEKRLPVVLSQGAAYDLRMDTPDSRRFVHFVAGAGASAH